MIKIDGHKVKELRENQGLTQLYLATAVEVTTDTISRWENKRYPSIKKENGLKLAETLGVALEDILEMEKEPEPLSDSQQPETTLPKGNKNKYILPFFLVVIVISLIGGYLYFKREKMPVILAHRILPERTIAGLPFPVVVKVDIQPEALALILKETLPKKALILASSPEVAMNSGGKNNIKWIQKIHGNRVFAYMVQLDGEPASVSMFSGTVSSRETTAEPIDVIGNKSIQLGLHHWADTNGDNIISDREILTVYDQYSDIEGFNIDIDLIERMWLGSGYTWDQKNKSFSILP